MPHVTIVSKRADGSTFKREREREREWERLLAMSGARKYCSPNYIENPDRIKLKHANNFILCFAREILLPFRCFKNH